MQRFRRAFTGLPIRIRVGLALGIAVLPFMVVLFLAYSWIYLPMQAEMRVLSHDIETRFDAVARLQVALTRATMPVNDYLIHGHLSERREFHLASARVEAAFVTIRNAMADAHQEEQGKIVQLYERWKSTSRRGESILNLGDAERRSAEAAMAMESLDAAIDRIVDEIDDLLDNVRRDLRESREHLEIGRERMTWFVTLSIMIAAVVTLVTVVYLGQLIPRHIDPGLQGKGDDNGGFDDLFSIAGADDAKTSKKKEASPPGASTSRPAE